MLHLQESVSGRVATGAARTSQKLHIGSEEVIIMDVHLVSLPAVSQH